MFLFTTSPTRDPAPALPVVDAIRQGAERTGVGFDYLLATAKRESALDPAARARTSSASGLFQFIEQTWLGMIKSEGAKAGLGAYARAISTDSGGTHRVDDPALRQAILDLRQDPQVASVMAGALTQKNRDALRAELGRQPGAGELYVAHVLGSRGAATLIRAAERSPERPIAGDFPEAAAANRSIFFDRSGRARGAGEVYATLAGAHGASAAPAFGPDQPLAFAKTDGPAFHGLFQSATRTGPVSDAVARIWKAGRSAPAGQVAALAYFPSDAPRTAPEPEPVPPAASPAATSLPPTAPLPPRRPDGAVAGGRPLDLTRFMKWRAT
jgi:hypothetical protein